MLELVCTPPLSLESDEPDRIVVRIPVHVGRDEVAYTYVAYVGHGRRRVLGQEPVGLRQSRTHGLIVELHGDAHDVGKRFIERARFVLIDQLGREFRDAVRQLVSHDVKRATAIAQPVPTPKVTTPLPR